jgi:hypothetical protein
MYVIACTCVSVYVFLKICVLVEDLGELQFRSVHSDFLDHGSAF